MEVVVEGMQRLSESGTPSPINTRRSSISGLQRVNLAEQVRKGRPSLSGAPEEEGNPLPSSRHSNRQTLSALELAQRQSAAFAHSHSLTRRGTGREEDQPSEDLGPSDARESKPRYSFLRREADERPSLPGRYSLKPNALGAGGDSFNLCRASMSGGGMPSPRGSPGGYQRSSVSGGASASLETQRTMAEHRRGVLNASKPSRASLVGGGER
jgi:hypothetical protein